MKKYLLGLLIVLLTCGNLFAATGAKYIDDLTELERPALTDQLVIDDASAGETKKIEIGSLIPLTYFIDPDEVDQGATGSGRSLKDLVDYIGSDAATIIFANHDASGTTYTLTTGVTVLATTQLVFQNGAKVDGAGTLAVQGTIQALAGQNIFGSSLTVSLGTSSTMDKIYSSWWGSTAAAINAAIVAASASGVRIVQLPSGTITQDADILLKNGVVLRGHCPMHQGSTVGTILQPDNTVDYSIHAAATVKAAGIENIQIDLTNAKSTTVGVRLDSSWHIHTRGVCVKNMQSSGIGLEIVSTSASNLYSSHEDWDITGNDTGTGVKIHRTGSKSNTSTVFKNFRVVSCNVGWDIDYCGSGMVFIDCNSEAHISNGIEIDTVTSGNSLSWIGGEVATNGGYGCVPTANTRMFFYGTQFTNNTSGDVDYSSVTTGLVGQIHTGAQFMPGITLRSADDLRSFTIRVGDSGSNQITVTHPTAADQTIKWEARTAGPNYFGHSMFGFKQQTIAQSGGGTIVPDLADGNVINVNVTDGTAFTLDSPTTRVPGMPVYITIFNNSGGDLGTITWGGRFVFTNTFIPPSNGKRATLHFICSLGGAGSEYLYEQNVGENLNLSGDLNVSQTIIPGSVVSNLTTSGTFAPTDGNIFIRSNTSGTTVNLNPSGSFSAGCWIILIESGTTDDIVFDSAGLGATVEAGKMGIFIYDGSDWKGSQIN